MWIVFPSIYRGSLKINNYCKKPSFFCCCSECNNSGETKVFKDVLTDMCFLTRVLASQTTFRTHTLIHCRLYFFSFIKLDSPSGSSLLFVEVPRSHSHTTLDKISLGKWSARRSDLYLITHTSHDRYPRHRWDSNQRCQQREATDPRLRPRDHWDGPVRFMHVPNN